MEKNRYIAEAKQQKRKIIHVDMDCFYAAIEMRDNPSLKNKPLAVGGNPEKRGVLCTCNYLARKFGVKSAMSSHKALKICPNLIIKPPNFKKYCRDSKTIHGIFQKYTSDIEPIALDEAFLDVGHSKWFGGSATLLGNHIKKEIFKETGLIASVGIAPNKFLAKVGSDWKKPNGIFVISPGDIENFVPDLFVKNIPGVGKVTQKKLAQLKIFKCKDVQQKDIFYFSKILGKFSSFLFYTSFGIDHRPVESKRERKSIGVEKTFPLDLKDFSDLLQNLMELKEELFRRVLDHKKKEQSFSIKKIRLKVKYNDFSLQTIERKLVISHLQLSSYLSTERNGIDLLIKGLLKSNYQKKNLPIRLLGLAFILDDNNCHQQFEQQLSFKF